MFNTPQQTKYNGVSFTKTRESIGGTLNQASPWVPTTQHEWQLQFNSVALKDAFVAYILANSGQQITITDEFAQDWVGNILTTDFVFESRYFRNCQIFYTNVLFDGIKVP